MIGSEADGSLDFKLSRGARKTSWTLLVRCSWVRISDRLWNQPVSWGSSKRIPCQAPRQGLKLPLSGSNSYDIDHSNRLWVRRPSDLQSRPGRLISSGVYIVIDAADKPLTVGNMMPIVCCCWTSDDGCQKDGNCYSVRR